LPTLATAGSGALTDTTHHHRIDAGHRAHAPMQVDIGGREADGTPALVAVGHAPADAVRPTEQVPGLLQVAAGQRLADAGAAHALFGVLDGVQVFHRKPLFRAHRAQQREIALAVMPKAKIVPHQQEAHAEPLHQ
jgi:hypothetical protein